MKTGEKPEKGFYYHYKHSPSGGVFDYAYEVIGIAHHTEVEDFDASAMVVYRPLYPAKVFMAGQHWDVRPRAMFLEDVPKGENGALIPRFERITDPATIAVLEKKREEMYGR